MPDKADKIIGAADALGKLARRTDDPAQAETLWSVAGEIRAKGSLLRDLGHSFRDPRLTEQVERVRHAVLKEDFLGAVDEGRQLLSSLPGKDDTDPKPPWAL